MAGLPLHGGYYVGRSIIAGAQRCLNLYPEKNPEDSPTPYTNYLTPGLVLQSTAAAANAWRGFFLASNGTLYGVSGDTVYTINSALVINPLGTITPGLTTPVSMADNGNALVIVDGTVNGWAVNLATNAFAAINDVNYLGADRVDYLDTFLIFNQPGTKNWYSSLSNVTYANLTVTGDAFDPLYVASKTGTPDPISSLIMMHREIWILGTQKTTEVWYNAGAANFPFAVSPGVYIEHGCAATHSIVKHDLLVFWLSVDKDGYFTVFEGANYAAKKISTPAIADLIRKKVAAAGGVFSDAIGMTYKQDDHVFYILTFPTADFTIVYDLSENLWHERAWTDDDGVEHRHRANCVIAAYGQILVGDWENGNLYTFELDAFTDNGDPIVRRRGFRHVTDDGELVEIAAFRPDMQVGNYAPDATLDVSLRWSIDRGRTFGNPLIESVAAGGYERRLNFQNLGLGYDWVFEVFWSSPVDTAINGAWIDPVGQVRRPNPNQGR